MIEINRINGISPDIEGELRLQEGLLKLSQETNTVIITARQKETNRVDEFLDEMSVASATKKESVINMLELIKKPTYTLQNDPEYQSPKPAPPKPPPPPPFGRKIIE